MSNKEGLTINQLAEINAQHVTTIAALEVKCAELFADNTALKAYIDDKCLIMNPTGLGDVMDADSANVATPATDVYASSLRAEGVEMYAKHLKEKYEGIEYSLIGEYYTDGEEDRISDQGEIECALAFAAQIRI